MSVCSSIEFLILSTTGQVGWDLKMCMSYILLNSLKCKLISRLYKMDGTLREIFGFKVENNCELEELVLFCDFHNIPMTFNVNSNENAYLELDCDR